MLASLASRPGPPGGGARGLSHPGAPGFPRSNGTRLPRACGRWLVGLTGEGEVPRTAVVTSAQAFRRDIPEARAGMNVGLLLRGVRRDEVVRGQLIAAPDSIRSHRAGSAELYVLSTEEGGRRTAFATGYSPTFSFGTTHVTGSIEVGHGIVMPGERATVDFELIKAVGLEPGVRFALRGGGRTVGAGVVTSVRE